MLWAFGCPELVTPLWAGCGHAVENMPAEVDYESWASGYRTAVCDLVPVPEPREKTPARNSGIFVAYLIGLLIGYVVFKFSQE